MKVQILSDLHLSFAGFKSISDDAEVILIAGDNGEGKVARKMIEYMLSKGKHVVMISGNHEYYSIGSFKGKSMDYVDNYWSNLHKEIGDSFHYLNDSTCIINGYRFIGTTLWGNVPSDVKMIVSDKDNGLNDFKVIKKNGNVINPDDYNELNSECVRFLEDNLAEGDILLTHNAPCDLSIQEMFKGDVMNCCYVSDITDLIFDKKPRLVVHGHLHNSSAYMLGDTPVIANPRGYFGMAGYNKSFNPFLTVDLDSIKDDISLDMRFSN